MAKKKEESLEKMDLKQVVKDLEGKPLLYESEYLLFERPVDVMVGSQSYENVTRLLQNTSDLTFRQAIQQALLFNPERDTDVPPIEKRTGLAMKLTADTDVSFTSGEVTTITKCAKAYYSLPRQQSIIYLRILELIDPEEFNRLT